MKQIIVNNTKYIGRLPVKQLSMLAAYDNQNQ